MTDDNLLPFCFPVVRRKKITAAFDGGRISSDGGVMLLAQAERRLGIADQLARVIPDERDADRVTHLLPDILRARIFAIACGYEDADDLDRLRFDPAFKLACGRLPDSDRNLCSQPTVSRWENAPDLRDLIRLMGVMVDLYCTSYTKPPKAVTLDIDDTVDIVHGHQQLSLFNAHYDERCFLPIHVYDTATSRPVAVLAIAAVLETAGLEPEKVPAALAMADRICDDRGRDAARGEALAAVVNRIELSPIRLRVILTAGAVVPANPEILDPHGAVLVRDVPLRIKRRGVEMRFVIEGPSASPTTPDPVLLKEIRRAHRCFEALVSGQVRSVAELATVEGIIDRYVSSLLPLAFLAPEIVEAIAAGRQPPELTAHRLIRTVDLPIAWAAQTQLLGLV